MPLSPALAKALLAHACVFWAQPCQPLPTLQRLSLRRGGLKAVPLPHSSCVEHAHPCAAPGTDSRTPVSPLGASLEVPRHLLDSWRIQQVGQACPVDLQVLQGQEEAVSLQGAEDLFQVPRTCLNREPSLPGMPSVGRSGGQVHLSSLLRP